MKFHFDSYYDNSFYAQVGGLSLDELNDLELDFLKMLDYRLYVSAGEYRRYEKAVMSYTRLRERS